MSKQLLLENLKRVAVAISTQFGSACEVVIHDLRQPDRSVVFVAGNVTGRGLGAPVTDFVLSLLARGEQPSDVVNYIAHTPDGKLLKSSTVFITDQKQRPIGVFCINYDITSLQPARAHLNELAEASTLIEVEKRFAKDTPNLLDRMIQSSLERVLGSLERSNKASTEERLSVIADLHAVGAFRIRKSVPALAKIFNVSRHTIYKDLNTVRRPGTRRNNHDGAESPRPKSD